MAVPLLHYHSNQLQSPGFTATLLFLARPVITAIKRSSRRNETPGRRAKEQPASIEQSLLLPQYGRCKRHINAR